MLAGVAFIAVISSASCCLGQQLFTSEDRPAHECSLVDKFEAVGREGTRAGTSAAESDKEKTT